MQKEGKFYAQINRTGKQYVVFLVGAKNMYVGNNMDCMTYEIEMIKTATSVLLNQWFFIRNTVFQQLKWHLYTWTSPDKIYRNQIHCIIGIRKWKSYGIIAKDISQGSLWNRSPTAHVQVPSTAKAEGQSQPVSIIWFWMYTHHFQWKPQELLWSPKPHW